MQKKQNKTKRNNKNTGKKKNKEKKNKRDLTKKIETCCIKLANFKEYSTRIEMS